MSFNSARVKTWMSDPAREIERSSEMVELGLVKSILEILWKELGLSLAATTFITSDDWDSTSQQLENMDLHFIFFTAIPSLFLSFFLSSL
ncbi:hypothetical protein IC582_012057 [Cucumis melo]